MPETFQADELYAMQNRPAEIVAAVILYVLSSIVYFLFIIFLYILPVHMAGAIILSLPYLAYQFYKGFIS